MAEELSRPLHDKRRRVRVVRQQRTVGEQVPVARVDEQLGQLGSDRLDQLASMSPSSAKNGSRAMPWICTGSPVGHGPKAHSPVIGMQDS